MRFLSFTLPIIILILSLASGTYAHPYDDMKPLKLTMPELRPELSKLPEPMQNYDRMPMQSTAAFKPDVSFFRNKTNPGVKPYRFMDDMTFVGVPLFVSGILIKGSKNAYRQNYDDVTHSNTRLMKSFSTSIDNYLQYFGPTATIALKLAGVEGRSSWPRLLASSAMSYGFMALLVNSMKYTVKEMRPDGSTQNSWPSGHTATSFVGATILHKEYGMTRSPWYSVAAYTTATATGIMRVLNNRHWVSDVLSGAGLGILSTELGYALCDVFFKEKGLLRNDREQEDRLPSFFSISMGLGLGVHSMNFTPDDLIYKEDHNSLFNIHDMNIKFHTATTVDVEGAYFFNNYFGIGGRLRVRALTARQFGDYSSQITNDDRRLENDLVSFYRQANPGRTAEEVNEKIIMMRSAERDIVTKKDITIVSNHLTEFSSSVGGYFNLPLGSRFALGTKLLIGRSIVQELAINAKFSGNVKTIDYQMEVNNGKVTRLDINNVMPTGETYNADWDFLTLGGSNETTYGTGLSLTYRYKSNFVWKAFVDYDYTRKYFTLKYDPYRFIKAATPNLEQIYMGMGVSMSPYEFQKRQSLNMITIGGAFAVDF